MLSVRPWIGIALLAASWLFGLDYYELPSPATQLLLVVVGAWLLAAGGAPAQRVGDDPFRAMRVEHPELAAIVLFLLPVVWWLPWPYLLAPLMILAGVLLTRLASAPRVLRRVANAWTIGGTILMLQSAVLSIYAAVTARGHDVPALLVKLLAGLGWLAGIDAAGDGPLLVMQSMRQPIRLAITWDMVFDPLTMMFLVGGLTWIAIDAGRFGEVGLQRTKLARNLGRFVLIVLAWLPVRAVLMVALYLHRAALSDPVGPLHVANQFLSSWVLLAALIVPVLLAWRFVLPIEARSASEAGGAAHSLARRASIAGEKGTVPPSLSAKYLAAAVCCFFGAALVAVGLQWEPAGTRKAGRVKFVERHAPWSPSDRPYDTEHFGGGVDEDSVSYTYALAYNYLGQYYDMSRLSERDAIDDQTLAGCDVLVIKMPGVRYSPEEVQAVVHFVNNGGGLLLIGDHTNLDHSSAHMNDITRAWGFTFRDDVLYSTQPSPDRQHYARPMAPHPAIQHVPEFDFLVSCSIDPGYSWGRPVVAPAGLWSMPANYNWGNFMQKAEHVPEMRFGAFIQAYATHAGKGRAIAWGDSTIFSSFCIGQTGKFQVLLNMVEWLNRQGGTGVWWLWTLLGLAAIGNGLWMVREDVSSWLVLLAATACGWTLGTAATAALLAREMPLPAPVPERTMPLVVIDRTTSRVPLSNSDTNDDPTGMGFGLFEQWIPRLGYRTARAEGDALFQGDAPGKTAIVMLYPKVPIGEAFHRKLIEYVKKGGRLLVVDAGMNEVPSTANQILSPFGLSLDYGESWPGELVLKDSWPRIQVDHAWEVHGGTSFATLNGERSVCSIVEYGKGLVMVVSFGTMFNDLHMSGPWAKANNEIGLWGKEPTPGERARYDVLFAILRRLVEDKPLTVPPARTAPSPSISPRPLGEGQGVRAPLSLVKPNVKGAVPTKPSAPALPEPSADAPLKPLEPADTGLKRRQ
jgi:hypothetical protein